MVGNWKFTAPSIKIDLRVGGKNIFAMHGPKGSGFDKDIYSAGIYKEIIPMKKIVISDCFSGQKGNKIDAQSAGMALDFPDELIVDIRFEGIEKNKPELTILYQRPDSNEQVWIN